MARLVFLLILVATSASAKTYNCKKGFHAVSCQTLDCAVPLGSAVAALLNSPELHAICDKVHTSAADLEGFSVDAACMGKVR